MNVWLLSLFSFFLFLVGEVGDARVIAKLGEDVLVQKDDCRGAGAWWTWCR